MRKIVVGGVIAVGVAIAGLFVLRSAQAPGPARFLPNPEGNVVELHLEHTTQVVEALASLAKSLGSGGRGASLEKIAPALGQSAWLMNMAADGPRCDLWCVAEISDPDRASEVASVLAGLLGETSFAITPLEGEFPQNMSPLFRLQKDSADLCVALCRTDDHSLIMGAPSVEDLVSMLVEKDRPVERKTQGPDWGRLLYSSEYLRKAGFRGIPEDLPIKSEWGVQVDEEKMTLSSWSDGTSVLLSPEERRSLTAMPPVSLYGGGALVGLLAWTGIERENYPSREDLLAAASAESHFALETVGHLMESVGMTWDDLIHVFNRRTSIVFGSEAQGLFGDFPGGYILWEGVSSDLGRRLTDVAQTLSLPFGVAPLHVEGWDGGLSLRLPVTAVMAYGPSGLLMGIVNPDGLNRSPQIPSSLEKAVTQKGPVALAVDVQELSRALDVYGKIAGVAGGPMDALGTNVKKVRDELSRWEKLVLRYDDLERSTLTLYRRR